MNVIVCGSGALDLLRTVTVAPDLTDTLRGLNRCVSLTLLPERHVKSPLITISFFLAAAAGAAATPKAATVASAATAVRRVIWGLPSLNILAGTLLSIAGETECIRDFFRVHPPSGVLGVPREDGCHHVNRSGFASPVRR